MKKCVNPLGSGCKTLMMLEGWLDSQHQKVEKKVDHSHHRVHLQDSAAPLWAKSQIGTSFGWVMQLNLIHNHQCHRMTVWAVWALLQVLRRTPLLIRPIVQMQTARHNLEDYLQKPGASCKTCSQEKSWSTGSTKRMLVPFTGSVEDLSALELDRFTNSKWPAFAALPRSYFLVNPQPRDDDIAVIHILVEFWDENDAPHPAHIPTLEILHLWLSDGEQDQVRQAVYYDQGSNKEQLLRGLGEWCNDRSCYRCDVWHQNQPVRRHDTLQLQHGDLLTMRVAHCQPTWPMQISSMASSLTQQQYYSLEEHYGNCIGRTEAVPRTCSGNHKAPHR